MPTLTLDETLTLILTLLRKEKRLQHTQIFQQLLDPNNRGLLRGALFELQKNLNLKDFTSENLQNDPALRKKIVLALVMSFVQQKHPEYQFSLKRLFKKEKSKEDLLDLKLELKLLFTILNKMEPRPELRLAPSEIDDLASRMIVNFLDEDEKKRFTQDIPNNRLLPCLLFTDAGDFIGCEGGLTGDPSNAAVSLSEVLSRESSLTIDEAEFRESEGIKEDAPTSPHNQFGGSPFDIPLTPFDKDLKRR